MKFGFLLIFLALGASLFSAWHYFRLGQLEENKKIKESLIKSHRKLARLAFYTMSILVVFASLYLWYLIFSHQFQVSYVFRYTSRDLGLGYLISTFWAGQEGSFLFWALMISLMGILYMRTAGNLESYSMGILNLVQAAFLILLIVASPFSLRETLAADGAGLNPLLQNPWMVIHPPMLFLGYAAISIPFIIALSALLKRDFENWVRLALPWSLFASITIGGGIILGAYWAYKVLGWGGYWGWDPVENSSLIAWMVVLAFFHGLLITKFRGAFHRTNFAMAIASFVLVLYATFLTRSGVLADFSVHSFQDLGINAYLTVYIFTALISGILLIFMRRKEVPNIQISFDVVTKEQILVYTVAALLFSAFLILIGTSSPLLTQLIGNPSQVETSFYNNVNLPVVIIICLLLGIAPFLIWKEEQIKEVVKRLVPSIVIAIAASIVAVLFSMEKIIHIIFVGSIAFAFTSNLLVTVKKLRQGWRMTVASFSHVGVALLFIGIIISGVFSKSQRATITKNIPVKIMDHEIVYKSDFKSPEDGKDGLIIEVTIDGKKYNADPRLYMNSSSREMMSEPFVKGGLFNDFYLSLSQKIENNNSGTTSNLSIIKGEQKKYAGYDITFKSFEMGSHENTNQFRILAVLQVIKDGHSHEVRPGLIVEGGSQLPISVEMPGTGYSNQKVTVQLANVHAEKKQVDLSFTGLEVKETNTSNNDQVVLEISEKPFMGILWIGTILLTLGTILAMKRRSEELKQAPVAAIKKSTQIVCKKCKTENEPDAKFCAHCGHKLPANKSK